MNVITFIFIFTWVVYLIQLCLPLPFEKIIPIYYKAQVIIYIITYYYVNYKNMLHKLNIFVAYGPWSYLFVKYKFSIDQVS